MAAARKQVMRHDGVDYDVSDAVARSDRARADLCLVDSLQRAAARPGNKRWFVITVPIRHEIAVADRLTMAGVEVWRPERQEKIRLPRRHKARIVRRTAFRGYLFVHVVPEPAAFVGLLHFKGVKAIVGSSTGPTPVADGIINKIRQMFEVGVFDQVGVSRRLVAGDRVRILAGPFGGFAARVLDGYAGAKRVRVLANLFGRQTRVELGLDEIDFDL